MTNTKNQKMTEREQEKVLKIVRERQLVREVRKELNVGETDPRMILCTIRKYVDIWATEKDIKKALRTIGK